MMSNIARWGNFTSSQIWRLCTDLKKEVSACKPALTYIKEKVAEERLGRSINIRKESNATKWGTFVENRVHDLLGFEYRLCSTERITHPTVDRWSGMPDMVTDSVVVDIKCPEVKAFTELYSIETAEHLKTDSPEYYWQLVSNAILTGLNTAQLIIYCPYQSELPDIRLSVYNYDGTDQHKYQFIAFAEDDELPYLIEGNFYKNLHTFEFHVPEEDKQALTERVIKANEIFNQLNQPKHHVTNH